MGETVSLGGARIEVEERPGYLYMVEHGTLRSVDEVQKYAAAMELLAERTGIRRALIDSRSSDPIEPPREVREAMWKWLLSARAFDQIAFLLKDEMHVARVNMTALSQRASVKAFALVHEAHRWLSGRQRTLSQGLPAVTGHTISPPRTPLPARGASSTPPPPMTPTSLMSPATSKSSEISIGGAGASAGKTGRFQAVRPPSTPAMPAVRRSDVVPPAPRVPGAVGDGTDPEDP